MEIVTTSLEGVLIIKPNVFEDTRGYFFESYNKETFFSKGIREEFIQDNQSLSQKGVLRGLHFQNPPFAQGKLVRVIKGAVQDVAVDIRKASPTYGSSFSYILDEKNKHMMWIPSGFAHGFLTLEDQTIFAYKCTNVYNKSSEGSLKWDDPAFKINWLLTNPLLSEKDGQAPSFKDFTTLF